MFHAAHTDSQPLHRRPQPIGNASVLWLLVSVVAVLLASISSAFGEPRVMAGRLTDADIARLTHMAEAHRAGMRNAEIAADEADIPQVRDFALKAMKAHERLLLEVTQFEVASGHEPRPTESATQLTRRLLWTGLTTGRTFEMQFLSQVGMRDHETLRDLLTLISQQADHEELKQLAHRHIRPVDELYLAAKQLSDELDQ